MMRGLLVLAGLIFAAGAAAQGVPQIWEQGKHYFLVDPPQPTEASGKVEVLEVFSYGCPACNMFQPVMRQLQQALPNAAFTYLHASFRSDESWPLFQRAFYTAKALGIADKTHDAMFAAVWGTPAPLAIHDAKNKPLTPTLDDVAKVYAKFGVTAEDFAGTANSFSISTKMKQADAYVKATGVDATPTVIVNGKYRLTAASAGGRDQLIQLVRYLVDKETPAK